MILSLALVIVNGGVDLHLIRNFLCSIFVSMISFLFWYQEDILFPLLYSVLIGKRV